MTTINVSRIAGCSSLLPFNERTATWGKQCFEGQGAEKGQGMLESRLVPTLTLETALSLAPAHLPIEKLKSKAARASARTCIRLNVTAPTLDQPALLVISA